MTNSKELHQYLLSQITLEESAGERESIVSILLDHYFGLTHLDVLLSRPLPADVDISILDNVITRINANEPVQYVTNEAYFCRRKFLVSPAVLIPRPETEELVLEVEGYIKKKGLRSCRILDLGTGSGCIAVTLALNIPDSTVMATDIREDALHVALLNMQRHGAKLEFVQHDMLSAQLPFHNLDIIVSNPPYIPKDESMSMHRNVLDFEPHVALFVPDDDPLQFYKAIATHASKSLNLGGLLIVEVSEHHGHGVADLFAETGFADIEIIYDLSQKQRIVKAIKNNV